MRECIVKAPNTGEESILFKQVFLPLAKGSTTQAKEYYGGVLTDSFIQDFGDWRIEKHENGIDLKRYLFNGEPNIFKEGDFYYYINKIGETVPFFLFEPGLNDYFQEELPDIINAVAYNAYITNFGVDFNALDVFSKKFNLTKTVENFLQEAYEETENSDISLLQEYIPEIVEKVKELYKELGLIYTEDTFKEDTALNEEERALVPKEAFTQSTTNKVTANVKLKLSFLPSTRLDDIFSKPTFVPFGSVYKTLLSELAAINDEDVNGKPIDPFREMLSRIEEIAKEKPYFTRLIDILTAPNTTINSITEFIQTFTNVHNNFFLTEINKKDNSVNDVAIKNVSDNNSVFNTILKDWKSSVLSKLVIENIQNITQSMLAAKNVTSFVKILSSIGIEVSEQEVEAAAKTTILPQLISNTVYFLRGVLNGEIAVDNLSSNTAFVLLAKIKAKKNEDITEDVIHTKEGLRWVMSNPSYIDKVITYIQSGPEFVTKLAREKGRTDSVILKYLAALDSKFSSEETRLAESKKRLSNIKHGIGLAIQEKYKAKYGIQSNEMTVLDNIVATLHKTLQFKLGKRSTYATATPGNKSTHREIGFGLNFNSEYNSETKEISDEIVSIFFEYYKGEYRRAQLALRDIKNGRKLYVNHHTNSKGETIVDGKYVGNAFKSQIFQKLSQELESFPLFDEQGAPLLDSLNVKEVKSKIKEYIKSALVDRIEGNKTKLTTLFPNGISSVIETSLLEQYDNIDELLADYTINNLINQIEFGKIFVGDPSYFANMEEYNKRVPGTYTSGLYMRLGLNATDKFFNIAVIEGFHIKGHDLKKLKEILPAHNKDSYDDVNVTDAQAWITPARWKFIMRRIGKWTKLHSSYYNKIIGNNKEPITKEEFLVAAQPLKGTYYNVHNGVPVYLKYSQAVLLPELIKGSKILKGLYDKMTLDENGKELPYSKQIHEVVVSDGVKVGSLLPDKVSSKGLTKVQLHNRFWKLQQDLHPKGFGNIDVGSQIQKVLLSGLVYNLDKEFTVGDKTYTGTELLSLLNSVVKELSNKGKKEIIKHLKINSDGVITDKKKFADLLISQLSNTSSDKNIIEALRKGLSIYAIPQKTTSLLNSVFSMMSKRTLKIQTNGGALIQMSNYGLSKQEVLDSGVKWLIDPKTGLKPPRIDYKTKTVHPGQILLPASFLSEYIPNYEALSSEELLAKIDPRILSNIIGYRIPDQKLSSNDPLEVIGILPAGMGDSIIPYSEITTKTGSDFDIDKMFIMMPHYKPVYNNYYKILRKSGLTDKIASAILAKEEILVSSEHSIDTLFEYYQNLVENNLADDKIIKLVEKVEASLKEEEVLTLSYISSSSSVIGSSKKGLQNKLIEVYKAILTHPSNFSDLMSPVDDPFLKNIITNTITEEAIDNLSNFDIIAQLQVKHNFMGGNTGVGASANNLVDHFRSSFSPMIIKSSFYTNGNFIKGKGKKVKVLLDEEYSKTYKGTRYKIADTLSAVLNGFVDIEKDPYIMKANWNRATMTTGFYMIRSGIHPELIVKFLNHSIIRKFIAMSNAAESKSTIFQSQEDIISAIALQNGSTLEDFTKLTKLTNLNLLNKSSDLSVLKLFLSLKGNEAMSLKENIIASKADTDAPFNINSTLISDNYMKEALLRKTANFKLENFADKLITSSGVETALFSYFTNTVSFMKNLLEKNPNLFILGHHKVSAIFNTISNDINNTNLLSEDLGTKLESDYYTYLMSGFLTGNKKESIEMLTTPTLTEEVYEYNRENNNFFTDNLEPTKTKNGLYLLGTNNRFKPKEFKHKMGVGFKQLMEDNMELADKLVRLSFLTSGFQAAPFQFFEFLPNEWFVLNRANNFLIGEVDKLNRADDIKFIDQFYRHNWNDSNIVPKLSDSSSLLFPYTTNTNIVINVKRKAGKNTPKFLNLDGNLYQLRGRDKVSDVYFRTFKLGHSQHGRKVLEYDSNNKAKESMFPDNNVSFQENVEKSYKNLKSLFLYARRSNPIDHRSVSDILFNKNASDNTNMNIKNSQISLFNEETGEVPEC